MLEELLEHDKNILNNYADHISNRLVNGDNKQNIVNDLIEKGISVRNSKQFVDHIENSILYNNKSKISKIFTWLGNILYILAILDFAWLVFNYNSNGLTWTPLILGIFGYFFYFIASKL